MQKVVFVFVDPSSFEFAYRGSYHGGLASLSAMLKRAGHDSGLVHLTEKPDKIDRKSFVRSVREHDPDLVAFTATSNVYPAVARLASWVADEGSGVPMICGGIHPTFDPKGVLEESEFDMVCVGEGEGALVDVCDRMEAGESLDAIANIWRKTDDGIVGNPIRPLIDDLDSLPLPDRRLFDYANLYWESQGMARVMFSRGCPYSCTYCCNNAYRNLYREKGTYVRTRSVGSVIDELAKIKQEWPFVTEYLFDDDVLFSNKHWLSDFASQYPDEIGMPFSCNLRPNMVDEEVAKKLSSSGCTLVRIGLESGDPRIRRLVLNRKLSDEQTVDAVRVLQNAGIKVWSFNMVGLPGETPASALKTVKLNARSMIDQLQVSIFHPFKGTKLYDVCREEGMLSGDLELNYFIDSPLRLKDMTRSQARMFRRHFERLVKLYRLIDRLPKGMRTVLEGFVDAVVAWPPTAFLSEHLLRPLYYAKHNILGPSARKIAHIVGARRGLSDA